MAVSIEGAKNIKALASRMRFDEHFDKKTPQLAQKRCDNKMKRIHEEYMSLSCCRLLYSRLEGFL
jgi:type VI protein secretion system component Hcp